MSAWCSSLSEVGSGLGCVLCAAQLRMLSCHCSGGCCVRGTRVACPLLAQPHSSLACLLLCYVKLGVL